MMKKEIELGDGKEANGSPNTGTRKLYKVRYDVHSGSPLRRSYVGQEEEYVTIKKKKEA